MAEQEERKAVRFSARPPARFAKGADFNLWVKRLELYFREAKVPDNKRGEELVALLEDDAFRVVSQSGFVSGDGVEYEEVKKCLQEQYAPKGVELEWQRKLHSAHQERPETLLEFSGRLRMLADKAYPSWSAERRLEMAREQFIHGVISPSVQMRLLRKQPESLEAALDLASQWESVELAQQSLRGEKQGSGASLAVSGERDLVQGALRANTVEELALQVQQLSQEIRKLSSREVGEKRSAPKRVPVCWNCKQKGHIRRNCPQRKERSVSPKEIGKDRSVKYTSAVACTLILQGMVGGRPTRMLVDTGSSVTLVHEKVWNDISQDRKLLTPQCPVMAVNGDSLSLCGQIDLDLMVGKHVRTHTVLVVREMTQECLLGTDFLEQYGCVVDLGRRTMIMLGETIPLDTLYGSCISTCHVFVQETAVVPPYHEMRLQVQLEGAKTDGDYVGLFQPKAEMSTQRALLFACSVSPVHDGKAVVQLVNPSAVPVTLHCKEKVGQVSPWDGREGANMVEPALGTRLPARSTEAIGKAVGELMGDTSGLSREECAKLKTILHHFSDVISPARRLPFHQRDVVQKMIQGMLQQGIIEPSGGAWASPIVLVRKKDGSYRFCVDFRRLNSVTKKDVHPLPRIDDALDTLSGSKWFSTLDLASGYWQVEMDPADKEKTAFITPFGLHQFRVMPFGLTNAPSTFQRLMSMVLAGLSWVTCLVYLDDIIIFSRTVEEHLQRLTEVLQRLKEAGLKIKPSKCHLLCKSVRYLGYVVSEKGIAADADKIKCVENWPTPTDHESLRQFLGFASYYRKFIRNFADTAAPLHALTEKSKPWHWTELCDKAFVALKGKLASPPILSFPQFDRTFVVDADASQEGVGAVLSHLDDGRVIAYASRVLTKAECQYCATRRLRHGNADALSRIQCKQCGMHNGIAMPCLFHNAFGAVNGNGGNLWSGSNVHSEAGLSVLPLENSKEMQGSDADLRRYKHLVVRDGVLFRQWEDVPGKGCNKHLQLVVPRSWIGSVLQQLHSSPSGGHLGMFKTLEKVRSRFYWPGQRHDIEDWCRACELCAARKSPPRRNRAPMQQVLAGGPFQRVAMDILGPLPLTDRGNKYILVFGAPDVLHTDQGRNFESALFKEVCLLLGVQKTRTTPYHPQSDGLVERFNRTLLDLLSIASREDEQNWDLCIPAVMLAYRTSVQESTGCTPYFLLFGREARLPVDVMFGLPPNVPPQPVHQYSKDLRARLDTAYERVRERLGWRQRRQKMVYDRRRTGRPYGIGEWVWLYCPAVPRGKSAKLHSYWQGPYKVVKVFSNVLYLIQHRDSTRKKVVVHFDRLKPCARGGTYEQGTTAPRDAAVFSEAEESDVSDAEETEDDNLEIAPQEDNLEPERQEEQHEVEPRDDQQEQPPLCFGQPPHSSPFPDSATTGSVMEEAVSDILAADTCEVEEVGDISETDDVEEEVTDISGELFFIVLYCQDDSLNPKPLNCHTLLRLVEQSLAQLLGNKHRIQVFPLSPVLPALEL
ncbi:hypothetical protein EMCRGX_G011541 [Ephydatia muelleri]